MQYVQTPAPTVDPSIGSRLTAVEMKAEDLETPWLMLHPDTKEFQFYRGELPIAFSFKDIAAHADGSRITLDIGNLSSAWIMDADLTVSWGKGKLTLTEDQRGNKPIKEKLPPGRWTSVVLDLSGVKPSDFGHIRIERVNVKTISLVG